MVRAFIFLCVFIVLTEAQTTQRSSTSPTQPSYVCGKGYNCSEAQADGQPCQCDRGCVSRGDCCLMAFEVCFPDATFNITDNETFTGGTGNQTSQFRCELIGCRRQAITGSLCQCYPGCAVRNECCSDYGTICQTPSSASASTSSSTSSNSASTSSSTSSSLTSSNPQMASVTSGSTEAATTVTVTNRVLTTNPSASAPPGPTPSSSLPSQRTEQPTSEHSGEQPSNVTLNATLRVPTTASRPPGCYLYGCDNRSDAQECQCDSDCIERGDCCDDAINLCADIDQPNGTENGTAAATIGPITCVEIGCGSTGTYCSCVYGCLSTSNCCPDYVKVCLSITTVPPTTSAAPTASATQGLPSCVALSQILNESACGYVKGQQCQCDPTCLGIGDCCHDFNISICAPTPGPTTLPPTTQAPTTVVVITEGPTTPFPLLCANEGCDVYNPNAICQCLPNCLHHKDCCTDFVDVCKDVYNLTVPPTTTTGTPSSEQVSTTVLTTGPSSGSGEIPSASAASESPSMSPSFSSTVETATVLTSTTPPSSSPPGGTFSTASETPSPGGTPSASVPGETPVSVSGKTTTIPGTLPSSPTGKGPTSGPVNGSSSVPGETPSASASGKTTSVPGTLPSSSPTGKGSTSGPVKVSSSVQGTQPSSPPGPVTPSSEPGTLTSGPVNVSSPVPGTPSSSPRGASSKPGPLPSSETPSAPGTSIFVPPSSKSPASTPSKSPSSAPGTRPSSSTSSPGTHVSSSLSGATASPSSTSSAIATILSPSLSIRRAASAQTPSSTSTAASPSSRSTTIVSTIAQLPTPTSTVNTTIAPSTSLPTPTRTVTGTAPVTVVATLSPKNVKKVESLTGEEKSNCLTMSFVNIKVTIWIEKYDEPFRRSIVDALKAHSSSKRKRAVGDLTPDDVIYVSPTPRIVDNGLQVVFFVRDSESTVLINQLQPAVTNQRSQIEMTVGVRVVSGTIKQGIPSDLTKSDDSSGSRTLILAIACSVGGLVLILVIIGALYFGCRRRRSKYNIASTFIDVNYTNAAELIDDFSDPTTKTTVFRKTEETPFPDVVPMETFAAGDNKYTYL